MKIPLDRLTLWALFWYVLVAASGLLLSEVLLLLWPHLPMVWLRVDGALGGAAFLGLGAVAVAAFGHWLHRRTPTRAEEMTETWDAAAVGAAIALGTVVFLVAMSALLAFALGNSFAV